MELYLVFTTAMVPEPSPTVGEAVVITLNAVSEDDRYPIPHMQGFAANLIGTQVFSKVHLVRAYNQLSMNSDDIAKTARAYAIRTVRVFTYSVWFNDCCTDVAAFYGQCVS